ncbi:MAG: hypothetical protein WCL23_04895 [Candidatus Moraniibacteriota bacterium]
MEPITLIMGNPGKIDEARRFLNMDIDHVSLDLPEIQSLSSREIVEDESPFKISCRDKI